MAISDAVFRAINRIQTRETPEPEQNIFTLSGPNAKSLEMSA
jgi:hypothetical protein